MYPSLVSISIQYDSLIIVIQILQIHGQNLSSNTTGHFIVMGQQWTLTQKITERHGTHYKDVPVTFYEGAL